MASQFDRDSHSFAPRLQRARDPAASEKFKSFLAAGEPFAFRRPFWPDDAYVTVFLGMATTRLRQPVLQPVSGGLLCMPAARQTLRSPCNHCASHHLSVGIAGWNKHVTLLPHPNSKSWLWRSMLLVSPCVRFPPKITRHMSHARCRRVRMHPCLMVAPLSAALRMSHSHMRCRCLHPHRTTRSP